MKKVVLIDDDTVNNFITKLTLERNNLAEVIHECVNGKEGLTYLNALCCQDDGLKPDYILLDLNMPGVDGWQFLSEYKHLKDDCKAPVYILTSSDHEDDLSKANLYQEVKGYITKPLLAEKVANLFR